MTVLHSLLWLRAHKLETHKCSETDRFWIFFKRWKILNRYFNKENKRILKQYFYFGVDWVGA